MILNIDYDVKEVKEHMNANTALEFNLSLQTYLYHCNLWQHGRKYGKLFTQMFDKSTKIYRSFSEFIDFGIGFLVLQTIYAAERALRGVKLEYSFQTSLALKQVHVISREVTKIYNGAAKT